jgi:hypothetical protein
MLINFFTIKKKGAKRVTNIRRIHTEKVEFEAAETDGYVYGRDCEYHIEGSAAYVYVDLGKEKPYISKKSDPLDVEYKFFSGCRVCYAAADKDLDNDKARVCFDSDIILYC